MPTTSPLLARSELLSGMPIIDGRFLAITAQAVPIVNPATGETITSIPLLGEGEAKRSVECNAAALTMWRSRNAEERAAVLLAWFGLIQQNREDLARLLTAEQGKPLAEARSEIDYAASFVRWFAEEARRVYGEVIPAASDRRIMVLKQPVGIVGAITPWNFPAAIITRRWHQHLPPDARLRSSLPN